MSKAVLISIKPKWCELIARGYKTIEVRKTRPKLDTPFKCYIYMTRGNASYKCGNGMICHTYGGGSVIGEFVCDRIIEFDAPGGLYRVTPNFIEKECCLSMPELQEYGYDAKTSSYKNLYGWHISDLVIYDEPKELSEFLKPCPYGDVSCFLCDKSGYNADMHIDCFNMLTRPPQSWCYVEVSE